MVLLTDAEIKKQQDRWMGLSEKWLDDLWLANWAITYHWLAEPLDARPPEDRKGPTGSVCDTKDGRPAHVWVQWNYMAADVEVDLRIIQQLDDGELERLFVHEMMHIVLGGMALMRASKDAYKQMEEYASTWLAKALIWVRFERCPVPQQEEYTPEGPKSATTLPPTTVGPGMERWNGRGDAGDLDDARRRVEQPAGDEHAGPEAGVPLPHGPGVQDLPGVDAPGDLRARSKLPIGQLRSAIRDLPQLRHPDQVDAAARP